MPTGFIPRPALAPPPARAVFLPLFEPVGGVTVLPAAADLLFDSFDPAVVLGSLLLVNPLADLLFEHADPAVVLGSLTVAGPLADILWEHVDPTVTVTGGGGPGGGHARYRWPTWHWRRFSRWP